MNIRWKEHPIFLQVLLGCLLFLFLFVLSYLFSLLEPGSGLELFARANSTRTSIALTSAALMGPFPTATGPTPTPSHTPSITPTPTVTPTNTPTPTPIRYFINTGTPRTLVPHTDQTSTVLPPGSTSTSVPPTNRPPATRTPIPPTNPPRQPTSPPQPTNPPPRATNPPPEPTRRPPRPTKTDKPPKPTKTPRR
ncbi:MAG TPA: hypothetical protein VJ821_11035 [Anaerolineales bacterium]|nr:hypothetical protein [Anaerolineales bacterium]